MNEEEKLAGADPALNPARDGLEEFEAQRDQARNNSDSSHEDEDEDENEDADVDAEESGAADASSCDWLFDRVEPLTKESVLDPRLRPAPLFAVPYDCANTEEMLQALIAECHLLMRHVSLPTICTSRNTSVRREFLNSAMELVRTGTYVAETIGHLRRVEHKAARKAARR